MLNEILDNTMEKSKRHENLTRATKYSSVYKSSISREALENSLMNKKIKKYTKKGPQASSVVTGNSELIVEDPSEVPVKVDFHSGMSGVPFFRSLYMRLLQA